MELCIKCKVKEAKNKSNKCLDCDRQYYRNFYHTRKELGLCIKCHRKNNSTSLLCEVCCKLAKIAQNDRRILAKNNFLCVVCVKHTDGQHTECEKCRIKRKIKIAKTTDQDYLYGKCGQCHKNTPVDGLKTCFICLEKSRRHYVEKIKDVRKKKNMDLKLLVFNHYGHKCNCCGENHVLLLNVDHVNNDGNIHRKTISTSVGLYKEIISSGFPDLYQLLCWNCNMGKHLNGGVCPHNI